MVDMGQFPLSEEVSFTTLKQVYLHAADSGSLPVRVQAMVPLRSWQATRLQQRCRPQHTSTTRLSVPMLTRRSTRSPAAVRQQARLLHAPVGISAC